MTKAELERSNTQAVAVDAIHRNGRHVLSQLLFDIHDSEIVVIESMEVADGEEVLGG